jgi:hypothetical protein
VVDHTRQILAEILQQLVTRHAALRRELFELIGAKRLGEIAGRNLLVRTAADP